MKRSEVNNILREGDEFMRSFGFHLPPFAYLSPDKLREKSGSRIFSARLGWDITDYGRGNFAEFGLFLFTVRNGEIGDLGKGGGLLYAEKIMITRRDQISPMHRHNLKAEDIVNRGGGTIVLELYSAAADGSIDRDSDVAVQVDGELKTLPPGGPLKLDPGESVTLMPGVWHGFTAEGSDCLIGEISTVNDDLTDNVFEQPIGRFSDIEEDEPPLYLLVSDY
ncbi:MAG: D-lyxose/D-mannose family sugar isomerase [Albidovulum sp.]|nr:D-lyxose/D-mannose family sugar isomerase [Albidovulum sp.]